MDTHHHEDIYALNTRSLTGIQQFLQGDANGFDTLIELFGQRVMRLVQKMIYSHHDAQDVYNEIWLKVAQNLHKYDQSLPFHSWLYRLASNTCIDFLRKKRDIVMEDDRLHVHVQKENSTYSNTPESLFLEKEFQTQLNQLLSHLDETDRLIVTLRFSEELSYEEIGSIVGMSKNTVGTRLFRARKQLKQLLQHLTDKRRSPHVSYR
ncbi:sigma-70 family RNA polymerase sigma factor [Brevibacillus humidisoli]|uniref:RNA polymerase sigma factor n=1 Tax=Brevibacillus humidisoli TaxID=2895522 RepID=UPI001E28657C|nr:sigma-70 family RNA polymerase sigma factor [Brevibacillus humidisoli]UFJ39964.1 sigma-70 family RNA polymerase sigma factor [Brevibacillus humidisoli]